MQEKSFERILITAALPYANGPVHIGHLAGNFLPADVYSRFQKANKRDVLFICGSDEHGVPITIRAMKEGVTPQDVVDKYHELIKESLTGMNINFDNYSRTSNDIHKTTSQEFFRNLYDKNIFEEKTSEQYFDPEANQFLADRYIVGNCPKCSNDNAFGDQCEKCGSTLSPEELLNPRSALSNATPVKKETKHWYLPLQNYENWLKDWLLNEHKDWKSNVIGQCKSWIDSGLQARAMTRDSNWGVPVPVPNAEGKVMYVWFDAPIGYISATKELTEHWEKYWKDEKTKLVHFIGKDNIVFHCIIFPAMLKAHGDYILPENVPANEFLNIEGQKVSTSRNWAIWVHEYLNDFPDGADMLRYVLIANAPENKDNDFTWKDFQDRVNNELVAVYGNFINRNMVLVHKLCGGKMPKLHTDALTDLDQATLACFMTYKTNLEQNIEQYKFREALYQVIDLARIGNKYMQDCEPWIKAKSLEANPEVQKQIDNCLHICTQLMANLAILSQPFLPTTSSKICKMLTVVAKMLEWENAGKTDLIKTGYSLRTPELLFNKIENEIINQQVEKLHSKAVTNSPKKIEFKPMIEFEDFSKIDLRIGTINTAKKVDKADKLLHLEINIGTEIRTILSGIAEHYNPEDIIGKQVVVVANLKPRKMRGIESQGMILMSENNDGKLLFVSPESVVNSGAEVK